MRNIGYRKPHIYARGGSWAVRQTLLGESGEKLTAEFLAASDFALKHSPFWRA